MGACHAWEHTLIIYHIERGDRPLELFKILGTIAVDNSGANKSINETSGIADKAKSAMSASFSAIGSAAVAVGKAIAVGLAAGSAAMGALMKTSVDNYANYEQLIGGVETLFGTSAKSAAEFVQSARGMGKSAQEALKEFSELPSAADTVIKYAADAYMTAGLSANEYMETVTSFSASLLQSVGGDTAMAAEIANMAITDMSDNANKMGSDMESIKTAYAGFAKGQFTLLDNLKLGYGGTKTEMQRLLADATALSGVKYDLESYADIVDAIHVIQTEMGITGTTAKEASATISGSIGMMKAAWANFLTGMADDTQDFDKLCKNLIDSVITVSQNMIPRIQILLPRLVEGLSLLAESLIPEVTPIVMSILPGILEGAVGILEALFKLAPELLGELLTYISTEALPMASESASKIMWGLIGAAQVLIPQLLIVGIDIIKNLANGISKNIDMVTLAMVSLCGKIIEVISDEETVESVINAAVAIVVAVAEGIVMFLPKLADAAIRIVMKVIETITDPDTLSSLIDAAIEILLTLVDFLVSNVSVLVDAAITIISSLIEYLLDEENMAKIIGAAIELIAQLALGLLEAVGSLFETAEKLAVEIINGIMETDWLEIGRNIVKAIGEGISNAWNNFVARNPLSASGLIEGINVGVSGGMVNGTHADGLDYVPFDGYVAELHKGEMVVPALESKFLRSGAFGNAEVVPLLERILVALEDREPETMSVVLNNREFARLVKAVN